MLTDQGAAATASDSPFATPDTITNFTPDTDKLHLPSDSVATNGLIGLDDSTAGTGAIDFGTVTNGVIVFSDDAETPAAITIDSTDAMTAALTYLSANVSNGDTVAFDYDIDSVSGTIVFQGDAGGDIAVNLIGVSASSLGADLDLVALP